MTAFPFVLRSENSGCGGAAGAGNEFAVQVAVAQVSRSPYQRCGQHLAGPQEISYFDGIRRSIFWVHHFNILELYFYCLN